MPTSLTENYIRLHLLNVEGATPVLRRTLICHVESTCQSGSLDEWLFYFKSEIRELQRKKVLSDTAFEILFPSTNKATVLEDWDVSLLCVILLNFCSLSGRLQELKDVLQKEVKKSGEKYLDAYLSKHEGQIRKMRVLSSDQIEQLFPTRTNTDINTWDQEVLIHIAVTLCKQSNTSAACRIVRDNICRNIQIDHGKAATPDIDRFLSSRASMIVDLKRKGYISQDMYKQLNSHKPSDIYSWDNDLLVVFSLHVCKSLSNQSINALKCIRTLRKEMTAHKAKAEIENGEFLGKWTDVHEAICTIIKEEVPSLMARWKEDINYFRSGPLDMQTSIDILKQVYLKENEENKYILNGISSLEIQINQHIDRSTDRICDEFNTSFKELTQKLAEGLADVKNAMPNSMFCETIEVKCAKIIFIVKGISKEASRKAERIIIDAMKNEDDDVKRIAAVSSVLEAIVRDGNVIIEIKHGSVILTVTFHSLKGMLAVLNYMTSQELQSNLKELEKVIETMTGNPIVVSAYIQYQSLLDMIEHLETINPKKSRHSDIDVIYNIRQSEQIRGYQRDTLDLSSMKASDELKQHRSEQDYSLYSSDDYVTIKCNACYKNGKLSRPDGICTSCKLFFCRPCRSYHNVCIDKQSVDLQKQMFACEMCLRQISSVPSIYCTECERFMCETCTSNHDKYKPLHTLTPLITIDQEAKTSDQPTLPPKIQKVPVTSSGDAQKQKLSHETTHPIEEEFEDTTKKKGNVTLRLQLPCMKASDELQQQRLSRDSFVYSSDDYVTMKCNACNKNDKLSKPDAICRSCKLMFCRPCRINHNVCIGNTSVDLNKQMFACEMCLRNISSVPSVYCTECEQFMCTTCTSNHDKYKPPHKLTPLIKIHQEAKDSDQPKLPPRIRKVPAKSDGDAPKQKLSYKTTHAIAEDFEVASTSVKPQLPPRTQQKQRLPHQHPEPLDLEYYTKVKEIYNIGFRTDTYFCEISACAVLPNNNIVLSDIGNSNLKLFTPRSLDCTRVELEQFPWDLCVYCEGANPVQVWVTVPEESEVHIFEENDDQLFLKQVLNVGGECRGITSCSNELAITVFDRVWRIEIYMNDGQFVKQLNQSVLLNCIRPYFLTALNNSIVVSDNGSSCITGVDVENEVKSFEYRGELINNPLNVTVDDDENLYVCNRDNVCRISLDGYECVMLNKEHNHLSNPTALTYNIYNDTLLLQADRNKANMYVYTCKNLRKI